MTILGILLIDSKGNTLYKKVLDIKFREVPIEPLVAAIRGIGMEMGGKEIVKTYFEKAVIFFIPGAIIRDLFLVLILDNVERVDVLRGVYILNKIEKLLRIVEGKDLREKIENIKVSIDKIISQALRIPDYLTASITRLLEKLGPMVPEIAMEVLRRRLGEDPILAAILWPNEFLKKLLEMFGWDSAELLITSLYLEITTLYPRIPQTSLKDYSLKVKQLTKQLLLGDRKAIIAWRKLLEIIAEHFIKQ
ncbi:MAG: hypothetical protein ACTSX9_05845 [Candidatus Njordarchaeales archaeon]